MDSSKAEKIIVNNKSGSFIIRISGTYVTKENPSYLIATLYYQANIHHMIVLKNTIQTIIDNKCMKFIVIREELQDKKLLITEKQVVRTQQQVQQTRPKQHAVFQQVRATLQQVQQVQQVQQTRPNQLAVLQQVQETLQQVQQTLQQVQLTLQLVTSSLQVQDDE